MQFPSERIEWLAGWLREQTEGVAIGPKAIGDLAKFLDLTAEDVRDLEAPVRARLAAAGENVIIFPVVARPVPKGGIV